MNMFEKVWSMLKGKANDTVDASIDPGTMMRQGVREMQDAIREYEKALTEARTQRNLIQNQYAAAQKDAAEWDSVAEVAVAKSQDDNAREALMRSDVAHENAQRFKLALDNMTNQITKLEHNLNELKNRKEQVATEATLLEARTKAADASIAINATVAGVGDKNFGEMMEIARKKADEKEARAQALSETSVSSADDLKAKILGSSAITQNNRVDDRLAQLKLKQQTQTASGNDSGSSVGGMIAGAAVGAMAASAFAPDSHHDSDSGSDGGGD